MRKLKHRKLSTLSKIKNQQADQEPGVVTGLVSGAMHAPYKGSQYVCACTHVRKST